MPGEQLDAELRDALDAIRARAEGASARRRLAHAEPPPAPIEVLFIDGDHSYEGAKADFERWSAFVQPGGHVLFHDAVDTGGYGNVIPASRGWSREIGAGWERQPDAGSIAHFVKRA